jgi:hypothetical protein
VAFIRSSDGETGYLYIKLDQSPPREIPIEVAVYFAVVLTTNHASGVWEFSDRMDPDADDAREELVDGKIVWFGKSIDVVEWLDEDAAAQVIGRHFAA